jgi:hypothetical protein
MVALHSEKTAKLLIGVWVGAFAGFSLCEYHGAESRSKAD